MMAREENGGAINIGRAITSAAISHLQRGGGIKASASMTAAAAQRENRKSVNSRRVSKA